jgi:hypothetical protein
VLSKGKRLAMIVLDPWELRFVAEYVLPEKNKQRNFIYNLVRKTICRERPQSIVLEEKRSPAAQAAKLLSSRLKLPLIILSRKEQAKLLGVSKGKSGEKDSKANRRELFSPAARDLALPTISESLLLQRAIALGEAALTHFLTKSFYDNRNHEKPKRANGV